MFCKFWKWTIPKVRCQYQIVLSEFNGHSNGIYWDVIEVSQKHHKAPVNTIKNLAISQFGARPLRYLPEPKTRADLSDWFPVETVQMLKELEDAGTSIASSDRQGARQDYENELMPALESIVKAKRMLYVSVDT
jgi:hypothetical protein